MCGRPGGGDGWPGRTHTGAPFDVAEVHVRTVRDGQVARFAAYLDGPARAAALAAPAAAAARG